MATDSLQAAWEEDASPPSSGSAYGGDSVAFLASLLFHLCLLVGLALVPALFETESAVVTILAPQAEEPPELVLPEEFHIDEPQLEVGANSLGGSAMAFSSAPELAELSEVGVPFELESVEISPIESSQVVELPTAQHLENLPVRGAVGEGITGAAGAVDRLTQEILLSLEERPTLVVWLFDQSASLLRQRQEIHDRLERVYDELGLIKSAGNSAFSKHAETPLLSTVVAFGQNHTFLTKRPTENLAEIKEAIASVSLDETGVERVFTAVHAVADRFKSFRRKRPMRNVMIVVFTDEAGEDQTNVDRAVHLCRRYEMPVYVVGIPAPFGRRETLVKWVDPDPKYDQTPQRGVVDQGPESLLPERIQLAFFGGRDPGLIDSGFGPFALTRLCYETGGIYFTVHPNRRLDRRVGWRETAAYSAHLNHFFDPEVMRKYRPDYVATDEYMRRLRANKARGALVQAARLSSVGQLKTPRTRFIKRNEGDFSNSLSEAQKDAATLEPQLAVLLETLRAGEPDRASEIIPRWQAGYDLATGRVLAAKVRTEGYNAMLAKAKRGLEFSKSGNNTWVLVPTPEISSSSRLSKEGEAALELLQRVVDEHPDTPWALLAARELKTPLGWKWQDSFTDLAPRRTTSSRSRPPSAARDDRRRTISAPPPRRPPPKL